MNGPTAKAVISKSPHLALATAIRELLEKRRLEAVGMLESCGVDPRTVPAWTEIWREGPRVHLERFMFTEVGRIRHDGRDVMIEEFSIEPDVIPAWITSD